jgi:hypothetical protein
MDDPVKIEYATPKPGRKKSSWQIVKEASGCAVCLMIGILFLLLAAPFFYSTGIRTDIRVGFAFVLGALIFLLQALRLLLKIIRENRQA